MRAQSYNLCWAVFGSILWDTLLKRKKRETRQGKESLREEEDKEKRQKEKGTERAGI